MTKTEKVDYSQLLDEKQRTAHLNFAPDNWLSSQKHVEQLILITTYYRRNIHRFAQEFLKLKLYPYQAILLYMMSRSDMVVAIASRAAAKSYLVAIYACCMAILYPNEQVCITSSTRGQSELIISKKIQQELCNRSPVLRREIKSVIDNQNKALVTFHGGGAIFTVTCNENARGNRCNVAIVDEARACDRNTLDKVIFPFLVVRQAGFITLPEYRDMKVFADEPKQIMISSSMEESHWLYKQAVRIRDDMFEGENCFFMAMDLAVTLKHHIRTFAQLQNAKRTADPITWKIEYENAVLRSNAYAYFTYDIVAQNQVLRKAFYPRKSTDFLNNKRNKYAIPKQDGEMRIVSCDIAMVDRSFNDNSVFSCMRLFPEIIELGNGSQQKEWRVQVPYMEGCRGSETSHQAIRIRQLYEDFDADYIVLDVRNAGRNAVSRGNAA